MYMHMYNLYVDIHTYNNVNIFNFHSLYHSLIYYIQAILHIFITCLDQ